MVCRKRCRVGANCGGAPSLSYLQPYPTPKSPICPICSDHSPTHSKSKMITEALVVQAPGADFEYREITVEDNLRGNEVLVQMKATGVCHTDLNFRNEDSLPGLHPAVFGHEGECILHNSIPSHSSCGHSSILLEMPWNQIFKRYVSLV